jgi:predicted small lipoprotein YifL
MHTLGKGLLLLLTALLAASLLTGCGRKEPLRAAAADSGAAVPGSAAISDEEVALTEAPAVDTELMPEASGVLVKSNDRAAIDYSNTADGYVMVKYTAATSRKLKSQVRGPGGTTYTYNISSGGWTTFPLSDGSGDYRVTVFENISGAKYATVLSASFAAALKDEFAPFLRPNQYVNYTDAVHTVAKAAALTEGLTDPLEKVGAVYNFVVGSFTYDRQEAASVQSGYLPDLDAVLAAKSGICFDYAALMTAMLRSQGIPCKLVVGYAGTAYHAWISVYSEEDGWVDAAIYFDGNAWQRMDPTFASSGGQSESVMKYIGDGSHYTAKYLY